MSRDVKLQNEINEEIRLRSLRIKNIFLQATLLVFVAIASIFMYKTYHEYNSMFPEIAPPPSSTEASGNSQTPSNSGIEARAAYGQYGDFIGGSLNPILSFLSLIAVLFTVSLQITELQQNREELRETREVAVQQKQHFENEAKKSEIIQALQEYEKEYQRFMELNTYNPWEKSVREMSVMLNYFSAKMEEREGVEEFSGIKMNVSKIIGEKEDGATNRQYAEALNILLKMDNLISTYKDVSQFKGDVPIVEYYKIKYKRHAFAFSMLDGIGESNFISIN